MSKEILLPCGGRRCCPKISFNEDGSTDITDNDDGKNERIHLSKEQTKLLKESLILNT
jgi:hypothetical protein